MIELPVGGAMFRTEADFVAHVVLPRALRGTGIARLYQDFCDTGYLARQKTLGIAVLPRLGMTESGGFQVLPEGQPVSPGHVPIVLLSNPSRGDEEFDELARIVSGWADALSPRARQVVAETVREHRGAEHGVPARVLSSALPEDLLVTYQRVGEYVAVIESAKKGHRRILPTRDIG
ncbi:hypothetical protein HQQ80_18195 [Microbacteriaceae bacterium VKM Ac-2855]|nr:hypothetical protein [Microbacteriaceae bacterium VKM Ac-2855]